MAIQSQKRWMMAIRRDFGKWNASLFIYSLYIGILIHALIISLKGTKFVVVVVLKFEMLHVTRIWNSDKICMTSTLNNKYRGTGATNRAVMPVHMDSEVYNMSHPKRGRALIFNHEVSPFE